MTTKHETIHSMQRANACLLNSRTFKTKSMSYGGLVITRLTVAFPNYREANFLSFLINFLAPSKIVICYVKTKIQRWQA